MGFGGVLQRGNRLRRLRDDQAEAERLANDERVIGGAQTLSTGPFTRSGPSPRQQRSQRTGRTNPGTPPRRRILEGVDPNAFLAGIQNRAQREQNLPKDVSPETFTPGKGFLAGRGFSLQPLGFNLPLASFQDDSDEGIFGFARRVSGGFKVRNRDLPVGFQDPSRRGKAQTLLTGRIRRGKLSRRGTILPPESSPVQRPGRPIATSIISP